MRRLVGGAAVVLLVGGLAGLAVPGAATVVAASKPKFLPSAVSAPWVTFGDDEGADSATDAYGLCRTASEVGFPFSYPAPTAAEVDAIVNDPINNSGSSNLGCTTPQNETTIAVNPTNAKNVIAGANDYRVCCDFTGLNDGTGWAYYSFDGGATWGNVQVPGLTAETGGKGNFKKVDSAGDPVMAFGPDGTAYYANIVFSRVSPASGVAVSTSTDGGKTWSAPNMVTFGNASNFFNDKEWIAAGPNGSVVVTWTKFNQGPHGVGYISSPIVAAFSQDRGKTWNRQGSPVSDSTRPFDQGSQPAFAPNGDLYVAYEGSDPSTGYATDVQSLARSTDGGKTFANTDLARVYDDVNCYPVFDGRQTLTNQHFRLNSYPSMSIDPSSGKIYLAWTDDQGAGTCGTSAASFSGTTSSQVKLVSGTWGSFSAVQRITPAGGPDTVFPSVTGSGGKSVISYYRAGYATTNPACFVKIPDDQEGPGPFWEATPTSVCLDYAARSSTTNYGTEERLTSAGSNTYVQFANGSFIGDYSQVAMGTDGKAHASWTDFRGRPGVNGPNQDVYVRTTSSSG